MTSIVQPHPLHAPAGMAGVERIAAALRSVFQTRPAAMPHSRANPLLQAQRTEAALARASLGLAVSDGRRYD